MTTRIVAPRGVPHLPQPEAREMRSDKVTSVARARFPKGEFKGADFVSFGHISSDLVGVSKRFYALSGGGEVRGLELAGAAEVFAGVEQIRGGHAAFKEAKRVDDVWKQVHGGMGLARGVIKTGCSLAEIPINALSLTNHISLGERHVITHAASGLRGFGLSSSIMRLVMTLMTLWDKVSASRALNKIMRETPDEAIAHIEGLVRLTDDDLREVTEMLREMTPDQLKKLPVDDTVYTKLFSEGLKGDSASRAMIRFADQFTGKERNFAVEKLLQKGEKKLARAKELLPADIYKALVEGKEIDAESIHRIGEHVAAAVRKNTLIAVAASIAIIASSFFLAGAKALVLPAQILSTIASLVFLMLDGAHFKEMLESHNPDFKNRLIMLIINVITFAAVTTAMVLSGGMLPIAVGVAALVLTLVTAGVLWYKDRHHVPA